LLEPLKKILPSRIRFLNQWIYRTIKSALTTRKSHLRRYISRLSGERMTLRHKGYLPLPFKSWQFTNGSSG